MIVALEGILESRGVDSAVIKVGPLSLRIHIPHPTLNQLGTVGNKIYLHTHLYMKEDNIALFGFASESALALFQKRFDEWVKDDGIQLPVQRLDHRLAADRDILAASFGRGFGGMSRFMMHCFKLD